MKKEVIKQIRNKMIKDLWEQKRAEWEISDLAFIFGLSIPQTYRVLANKNKVSAEKQRSAAEK